MNPMGDARRNATSRLDSLGYPPGGGTATGEGKQAMGDVHYRAATDPVSSCGGCLHFQPPSGCELVAGNIDPNATCDLFAPASGAQQPPMPAAPPAAGP